MSDKNNVPTEPGLYYRGSDVVRVRLNPETNLYSGLVYCEHGMAGLFPVEDDGLWAGPVPMPGEWVSIEEHKRALGSAGDFISDALNSGDGVYRP